MKKLKNNKKKNGKTYEEIKKTKNDVIIKYFKDVYYMIGNFQFNSKCKIDEITKPAKLHREYIDKDLLCKIGHRDIFHTTNIIKDEIEKYDPYINGYIGELLYYGYILSSIKAGIVDKNKENNIVNSIFQKLYNYYYNDYLGANLIKVFFKNYIDYDVLRYQLKNFLYEKGDDCTEEDLAVVSFVLDKNRFRYIQ